MAVNDLSLGLVEGGSDDLELFLKLFSGEVLLEMEPRLSTRNTISAKTVRPGSKSAQFRQMGSGTVFRHSAGDNLLSDTQTPVTGGSPEAYVQSLSQGEIEVFLDRPLLAAAVIDDWEQARNSFQARQPVARVLGRDLAKQVDLDRLRLMIRAAQGNLTQDQSFAAGFATSGSVINDANSDTDGSALLDALRQAEEAFSDADIPEEERHVALKPAQYNLLVQNQDLLNRDFGSDNGVFSDGTVFRAWGMALHKTTNLPTADDSSLDQTGVNGELYQADARNTVAVCWQMEGFASAEAEAIAIQAENKIELQGLFIVAKNTVGHGILRPDHFVQIRTAAP